MSSRIVSAREGPAWRSSLCWGSRCSRSRSFAVGWRLLWLAHRTGLLPEKLIGGSLFLAGGIGTALLIVSGFAGPARGVFSTAAMFAIDCGITVLGVFTWRVFRPGLVGATVVATCTALLFLSFASDWVSGHYLGVRRSGFSMTADYVGRFAMYGWASFETLRQATLARRRVRIGLTSRSSRTASCSGASARSRQTASGPTRCGAKSRRSATRPSSTWSRRCSGSPVRSQSGWRSSRRSCIGGASRRTALPPESQRPWNTDVRVSRIAARASRWSSLWLVAISSAVATSKARAGPSTSGQIAVPSSPAIMPTARGASASRLCWP